MLCLNRPLKFLWEKQVSVVDSWVLSPRELKSVAEDGECFQTVLLQEEPAFPPAKYIPFVRAVKELSPGLYCLQRRWYHDSRLQGLKYMATAFTTHLSAVQTKQILMLLKQVLIQVPDKWPQTAVNVQQTGAGVTAHYCNLCHTHPAAGRIRDRGLVGYITP